MLDIVYDIGEKWINVTSLRVWLFFHFKHDRKRLLSDIGLTKSDRKCVVNYGSTPLRRENGRLLLR